MKFWQEGEQCVFRGIVNNRIWLAQPVTVVKDSPEGTILLLQSGSQCMMPEENRRWQLKTSKSVRETRWQKSHTGNYNLQIFTWHSNRVLIFLEPEKYYSYNLYWDHSTGQFHCYSINFQLPYWRSHCGFDTLDLDLDIVVDPLYNWYWKDVEDYRNAIMEGFISMEWVNGVEKAQNEVLDKVKQRMAPMDGSWLDWRPDPSWPLAVLPADWHVL